MTSHANEMGLTADAFVAWASAQPRGRFELKGGAVVAMAPERIAHTRVKLDVAIALRTAIAARGLPCEALTEGPLVRIDDDTVYEPDALLRCGPKAPGDALEIADAIVIVEVVSPSSRGIDTGAKFAGYFRLASVRHYLVVDTEARVIVHHCRDDDDGRITTRLVRAGALGLDPPGLAVEADDFFVSL